MAVGVEVFPGANPHRLNIVVMGEEQGTFGQG
jgi:hypothetical protein